MECGTGRRFDRHAATDPGGALYAAMVCKRSGGSREVVFSKSAMSVLDCFRSLPEKRLTVAEITRETSIPRRTVQYALKVLTDKVFIQRMGRGAGTRYQLIF